MSIRIVYRNNIFYYFLMPGIWFSGALIYLGLGKVYAFYLVTKLLVICAAHSDVRWDKSLYEIKWLSPVMWVIERTISTPSTHWAHHGQHKEDGVTHYQRELWKPVVLLGYVIRYRKNYTALPGFSGG